MILRVPPRLSSINAFLNSSTSPLMLRNLKAFLPIRFNSQAAASETVKPLHGTVASHRSYILINAPSPPTMFPARFSTPLQRALQLQVTRWGGVVNFAWTGPDVTPAAVTAFSPLGGRIELPALSEDNVDEIAETLKQHATTATNAPPPTDGRIHMYVCTHGERDCRCGDTGGKVFQALKEEVQRRGVSNEVVLGEVGHVGGHQFAANLLVFPHGEWLGRLTPEDVPSVLEAILSSDVQPLASNDPPLLPNFWRGRMGLAKDEQLALHSEVVADRRFEVGKGR
ncbi:Sucrase/ferredoxin-like-domain-containing protein [Roridomyces roridus]|uniref:Sucrase/ferredoxin-like-domain-containing protein n=1 Tax=Roridomyces roridus TaxID=1738132 RepID=A0AAD7BI91_9AGAR|nr:Sucrase/ferredoxin-like-domain-containing protein [Roridomyces roridus]